MSETIDCPSCGATNPAGAEACEQCNFPFHRDRPASAKKKDAIPPEPTPPPRAREPESAPADAAEALPEPQAPESAVRGFDPGSRPVRRRRPRPDAMQPVQMQIWLFAGAAVLMGIVYFAAQGFWRSNVTPVAGAQPEQQQRADAARAMLERDSTNVEARIELANVLYDTGNWSEAIIHYRSAHRLDPKRATTVVDLGVCYYNLGQFAAAEAQFKHALELDPHQVFALFNLGIVAQSQERWEEALDYFHRAMQAGPPDEMKEALQQHLQTVMAKAGKSAPPLSQ